MLSPGRDGCRGAGLLFWQRIAQEKLGVPLATIHMQPLYYRSIYDATGFPSWFPRIFDRLVDRVIDLVFDRLLAGNEPVCAMGLSPSEAIGEDVVEFAAAGDRFLSGLVQSRPQPDWPANSVLPGWPFYYGGSAGFDAREIDAFLAEGEPPLVFSLSSVTTDGA